jgi:hypothetical protein
VVWDEVPRVKAMIESAIPLASVVLDAPFTLP